MDKLKLKSKICISLLSNFYWYNDMVLPLYYSLQKLGYTVHIQFKKILSDATNILIGLQDDPCDINLNTFPEDTILYNSEQIGIPGSKGLQPSLVQAFKYFTLWDYSEENINRLRKLYNIDNVYYVPLVFCPEMHRINCDYPQDIDIGFYGVINPYRQKILDDLKKAGINIQVNNAAGYLDRDLFIARCKMMLNIHFYRPGIQESFRLGYLWANKKCILCERDVDTAMSTIYSNACIYASYEDLVDTAVKYINQPHAIVEQAQRGYQIFSSRLYIDILDSIVGVTKKESIILPKILNMGSGKSFMTNAINIDINPKVNPDIILNISEKIDYHTKYHTNRFGDISLHDCMFDKIIANDILEHVEDLITSMTNMINLLTIGGELHINVPYDLSYGAWQDPTHVRGFNENSWLYYTHWHWYLHWRETKFDLISLSFIYSELGKKMSQDNISTDIIIRTPRAVDSMKVILRKRYTTQMEKLFYDKITRSIYNNPCSPWELNPYIE